MDKRRKTDIKWSGIVWGATVFFAVYLLGVLALSFLTVRYARLWGSECEMLTAWGMVSAICGGVTVRRIKKAPAAMIVLLEWGVCVAILLGVTYGVWGGVAWNRHTALLILCVLAGIALPQVLFRDRKGKKRPTW